MAFRYKIDIVEALKDAGYTPIRIRNECLLGESYMTQLRRGEMVSWKALDTICTTLHLQPGDLIEHVPAPVGDAGRTDPGRVSPVCTDKK